MNQSPELLPIQSPTSEADLQAEQHLATQLDTEARQEDELARAHAARAADLRDRRDRVKDDIRRRFASATN